MGYGLLLSRLHCLLQSCRTHCRPLRECTHRFGGCGSGMCWRGILFSFSGVALAGFRRPNLPSSRRGDGFDSCVDPFGEFSACSFERARNWLLWFTRLCLLGVGTLPLRVVDSGLGIRRNLCRNSSHFCDCDVDSIPPSSPFGPKRNPKAVFRRFAGHSSKVRVDLGVSGCLRFLLLKLE